MTEKKPYSQPQLFRVELNQEQAILSACSMTSGSTSSGGTGNKCKAGGCKRKSTSTTNISAGRPS